MHAISVKELRGQLPLIRSELKKGESFLVIYQSKPKNKKRVWFVCKSCNHKGD